MKKEEFDILNIKKRAEGKSYSQRRMEISQVKDVCKDTKIDKKMVEKQEKQIIKLEEKIEKQKNKIFNLKLETSNVKADEVTLSEIKKIISLVKEGRISKKGLKEILNISEKKITCAILFLKRNKLISEKKTNGATKCYQ